MTARSRLASCSTRVGLCASGALTVLVLSTPASLGFGTINGLGQMAEHERMTRASLACAANTPTKPCFEPNSMRQLAGGAGSFGGVGAPDIPPPEGAEAHCDDADFLNVAGYPQTRAQATQELTNCLAHLKGRFAEGITAAAALLDAQGKIVPAEVDLTIDCLFAGSIPGRAKCNVFDGFGRALHGVQDFYAHSNWADAADPANPVSITNPPGLNQAQIAPLLDLRAPNAGLNVPIDLSTGCFSLLELVGLDGCPGRIKHVDLNKDKGTIGQNSGNASAPTTPRGQVGTNFAKAVTLSIADSKRQWADFRAELVKTYGAAKGSLMVCALTHDDPVKECQRPEKMHAKGRIQDVIYASIVRCAEPQSAGAALEVRFPEHFKLVEVTGVTCFDDPAIPTPAAGFDTQHGTGTGTLDGVGGWELRWEFVDRAPSGEAGAAQDSVHLALYDPAGELDQGAFAQPPSKYPGSHQKLGYHFALPK